MNSDHPADRSEVEGEYICPACLSDAVDRGRLQESGDWVYLHSHGTYCIEDGDSHE